MSNGTTGIETFVYHKIGKTFYTMSRKSVKVKLDSDLGVQEITISNNVTDMLLKDPKCGPSDYSGR